MKTIEEVWQGYRDAAWPGEGMPKMQERECRLAFMAGFASMLGQLTEISDLPEDAGVVELEKLHQQMRAIGDTVAKENAAWKARQ